MLIIIIAKMMLLNVAFLFASLLQGHVHGMGELKAKGTPTPSQPPATLKPTTATLSPCDQIRKNICTPKAIKDGVCKCGAPNDCHALGMSCEDTQAYIDNAQFWNPKRLKALKVVVFGDPAAAFTTQLVKTADESKKDKRATAVYLITPKAGTATDILKNSPYPAVKESLDRKDDHTKPLIKVFEKFDDKIGKQLEFAPVRIYYTEPVLKKTVMDFATKHLIMGNADSVLLAPIKDTDKSVPVQSKVTKDGQGKITVVAIKK